MKNISGIAVTLPHWGRFVLQSWQWFFFFFFLLWQTRCSTFLVRVEEVVLMWRGRKHKHWKLYEQTSRKGCTFTLWLVSYLRGSTETPTTSEKSETTVGLAPGACNLVATLLNQSAFWCFLSPKMSLLLRHSAEAVSAQVFGSFQYPR